MLQSLFEEPYYLNSHLSVALVLLYWAFSGGVAAWHLRGALLALSERARWKSVFAKSSSPRVDRPGRVVLRGRARALDGGGPPVTVTVEQQGKVQRSKHRSWIVWNEVSRAVEARPFALELQDGTRVRVEPEVSELEVIDAFDRVERRGPAFDYSLERKRWTELTEGEEVWASGTLRYGRDPHATGAQAAGYRGDGRALVLRAGIDAPLLLSTEVLDKRELRNAGMHLASLVAVLVVAAGVNFFGFGNSTRIMARGTTYASSLASSATARELRRSKSRSYYVTVCRGVFVPETADGMPIVQQRLNINLGLCGAMGPNMPADGLRIAPESASFPFVSNSVRPGRFGALIAHETWFVLLGGLFVGGLHVVREKLRKRELGLRLDDDHDPVTEPF